MRSLPHYAEARQTADLFLEAAKLRSPPENCGGPKNRWRCPLSAQPPEPVRLRSVVRSRTAISARTQWARWANWTVGVSAAVLLIVSLSGFLYQRGQLSEIAAEHLRLLLVGPARLESGVANHYSVSTTSVAGNPLMAQIEFALYSPDGRQIRGHKEMTDESGNLEITIPAESIPSGTAAARMEVRGIYRAKMQLIDAELGIQPPRYATQLSFDKHSYRPGDTVHYRSLTLSRFGLSADRDFLVRLQILRSSRLGGARFDRGKGDPPGRRER